MKKISLKKFKIKDKRTKQIVVIGLFAFGIIGLTYFIYTNIFVVKIDSHGSIQKIFSESVRRELPKVQSDILNDPEWKSLRSLAGTSTNTPETGRANPFLPAR